MPLRRINLKISCWKYLLVVLPLKNYFQLRIALKFCQLLRGRLGVVTFPGFVTVNQETDQEHGHYKKKCGQ